MEYDNFIKAMEKLVGLPYSYRNKDFIMKYRNTLVSQKNIEDLPKPKYDSDGTSYITTYGKLRIHHKYHELMECYFPFCRMSP